MTQEEIRQERTQTVAISNEFIERSRYELTKTEQKAILYMASKIKPYDAPETEYIFSVKRFCAVCNLNKNTGTYRRYLLDMLVGLKTHVIVIPLEGKRKIITSWFNDAVISETEDEVKITFSKYLAPYLFELRSRYTSFYLENVLPMKSEYGISLYEYIKKESYARKKIIISLDELRQRTGCAGKYKQYSEIRIFVIEPALRDINLFTDIKLSYMPIKAGKKVISVEFSVLPPDRYDLEDRYYNRKDALEGNGID